MGARDGAMEAADVVAVTDGPARQPLVPEVLDRFVYLVGPPRSGTTIISRSFYLADWVLSCPNPTRFTHHVWHHRNKVDRRLLRQIFKRPAFYRERMVLRSLDAAVRNRIKRQIHDAFTAVSIAKMYQLYPLVYSLNPACEKNPDQALCWADKANDAHGLLEIAREMPKARFVFIIRDPRATIASMKGQIVRSREEIGLDGMKLPALVSSCLYWRNMMQTFLRLAARYGDRVYFLHYEDFVADAVEAVNGALEFASGKRMPQAALEDGLAQFRFKTKHDKSTEGSGIDRRPLDRWKQMLSPNEIDIVTALTWRTARKLDYPIEKPRALLRGAGAALRMDGLAQRAASALKIAYLETTELAIRRRAASIPRS